MRMWAQWSHFHLSQRLKSCTVAAIVLALMILSASQPAGALPGLRQKIWFALFCLPRSWPMLNYFGQKFKDNGYQLMNDRDSPVWQNPCATGPSPSVSLPIWHRVSRPKSLDSVLEAAQWTPQLRSPDRLRPKWSRLSYRWHPGKEFLVLRVAFFRRDRSFSLRNGHGSP